MKFFTVHVRLSWEIITAYYVGVPGGVVVVVLDGLVVRIQERRRGSGEERREGGGMGGWMEEERMEKGGGGARMGKNGWVDEQLCRDRPPPFSSLDPSPDPQPRRSVDQNQIYHTQTKVISKYVRTLGGPVVPEV